MGYGKLFLCAEKGVIAVMLNITGFSAGTITRMGELSTGMPRTEC